MDGEIKLGIVQAGLKKMYRENGWFDITTVKEICKLCGILLDGETESAMRVLHCVSFKDMDKKTRQWLADSLDKLFSDPDQLLANNEPQVLRSKFALSHNNIHLLKGLDDA